MEIRSECAAGNGQERPFDPYNGNENNWIEFYGADGMEGIIHPLNDDWMIGIV